MACQHPGCACETTIVERDGKAYCNNNCALSATSGNQGQCDCGHEGCMGHTGPGPSGMNRTDMGAPPDTLSASKDAHTHSGKKS